jgi:hypothetical protein
MSEKKSRPRLPKLQSERGLAAQHQELMQTFFKKGAQLSEQLLEENKRLRAERSQLDRECTQLRTQLASDDAIGRALRKIEELEREKEELLSNIEEKSAMSTRVLHQHAEMEQEIAALVNLYIASHQLHSTLDLARVTRLLRELLAQLVGARSYAIYLSNLAGSELMAVASEGPAAARFSVIRVRAESPPEGAAGTVERVFLTGVAQFVEGELAACVPLTVGDRIIGAIAIFSLLAHKLGLSDADRELFQMLGAHAGTALAGALLYAQADGKLPGAEAFAASKRGT